ncbi:MAG: hypothetical protein HY318_02950 [Armatimonadetes bacterium]|nr:hypothetical protein [Armatimonadota bacterium]
MSVLVVLSQASTSPSGQPQQPATVPRVLGKGTGGDGAWSCHSAAHSPTTVNLDEAAGPEGTPAAIVEFAFSPDKYNWNWADVEVGGVEPGHFKAVRLTYRTQVAADFARLNLMVSESSGGSYWAPGGLPLSLGRFRTVTIAFAALTLTPWSKDANGKLDAHLVQNISIGLETGRGGKGRLVISDVELVPEGW